MNNLALAFIGDAVYELYIREYLINSGIYNVNNLQTESIKYVSAANQKKYTEMLLENNILTEEELEVMKRGRNAKGTKNRSTDIVTYRIATGLECLIGDLYLNKKNDRIKEIMDYIVGEHE